MENATIKWEAPFSLDLTNVDPDISYCVDIYNITCGVRDHLISDCNVTETSYSFNTNGYQYEYTITPRSNTEQAMNGTPSTGIITSSDYGCQSGSQPEMSMLEVHSVTSPFSESYPGDSEWIMGSAVVLIPIFVIVPLTIVIVCVTLTITIVIVCVMKRKRKKTSRVPQHIASTPVKDGGTMPQDLEFSSVKLNKSRKVKGNNMTDPRRQLFHYKAGKQPTQGEESMSPPDLHDSGYRTMSLCDNQSDSRTTNLYNVTVTVNEGSVCSA